MLSKLAQFTHRSFFECFRKASSAVGSHNRTSEKIRRLLVANRDEAAVRIIKTARRMGIETTAVFSDVDRKSLHCSLADKAYYIGLNSPIHSYKNYERILDAAEQSGVQAIHPGYGFLSENPTFADMCLSNDLIFIGPPTMVLQTIASKGETKRLVTEAGVPVTGGYYGKEQTAAHLRNVALEIGLPVILKTKCEAGGKVMRVVWKDYEFMQKLQEARLEALQLFGIKEMIIEKYIVNPRYIGVQIFGDQYGNYVHFWERDCSIQRRHQKIIEETPAFNLSNELRSKLIENALVAARAVRCIGACTVEFILDENGAFYFNEVNTRLQAEHPITEEVTGIDLVEWQIRVAQGEKLPKTQEQIGIRGHAIEARIYTEDAENDFAPAFGPLKYVSFPITVRVDTGVREGDKITPYYDPLVAKITAVGQNRKEAIGNLNKALQSTCIAGPPTNLSLIQSVLKHDDYIEGKFSTEFLSKHDKELQEIKLTAQDICEYAVARLLLAGRGPVSQTTDAYFSEENLKEKLTVPMKDGSYLVEILSGKDWIINLGGRKVSIEITKCRKRALDFVEFEAKIDGQTVKRTAVKAGERLFLFGKCDQRSYRLLDSIPYKNGKTAVTNACAPAQGIIEEVFVSVGDRVKPGDPLLKMVSRKMEYVIRSPLNAIVQAVLCSVGENVQENEQLVTFNEIAAGEQSGC